MSCIGTKLMHFKYLKKKKELGTLDLTPIVSALKFDHYILPKCLGGKETILLFMKNLCP